MIVHDMDPFTEAVVTIFQEALRVMRLQVEEANADVIREREAARKAIEEAPPVITETSVLVEYTDKINSLTSEVETLKVSLQSERQAAEDLRKAFSQTETRNSELASKPENVTREVDEFCEENQEEVLVKCISLNLGYEGGKPVAAYVIYKCLLDWRSFEVERTNIFNRIVHVITSAIEVSDDNEVLAYWLSNSATLFCLLQPTFTNFTMPSSRGFKKQLIGFIKRIYGMIRDNLKKEIIPLLGLCLQCTRHGRMIQTSTQAQIAHWKSIVGSLSSYLNIMKANNVPPFLVSKVFTQIFSFINIQLFNSFLLRRECCSFSNGKYVEAGLAKLKQWCIEATDEYGGSAWDELRHTRQAVGFLVIREKQKLTLEDVTRELCPVLSIPQLYRISIMYWDDNNGVSAYFIASMRTMLKEDLSNALSRTFVLDDDLSIPFTVEDVSKSMEQVDANDTEPPQLICKNSRFSFLRALVKKVIRHKMA